MAQKSSKQRAEEAVLDLKGKLRQLNKALAGKGVTIAENAPLIATIKAVEGMTAGGGGSVETPITLFKESQFYQWVDETLPPTKLKEGVAVSLKYTFSEMKSLTALPEIAGIERASNISYMCKSSSALRSVSLPDLPKCTDATEAFSTCTSIDTIVVGNMPTCTSFYCFALSSKGVKRINIGDAPMATNVNSVAYDCPALEEFTANFGDKINNARYMFYNCVKLRRINGVLDITSSIDLSNAFSFCSLLEEVRIKGLKTDIDLSFCVKLSLESVRYLLENVQEVRSQRIDLSRALLEAHEEALGDLGDTASNKGWTINYK